jgi:hypothetical protein
MKSNRGKISLDGVETAPVATSLGVKPLKTGVGYSLYTDTSNSNFLLAEEDQTSKAIKASFTSSINFIDQVITKINETPKHAEKIKLLALYQQLYSIDEYDYEYIQKRTGIITDYRQVDLESFRKEIKTHALLEKFKKTEPEKRSKDLWIRTKRAIMHQYTCIELNKHFNKTLKEDALATKIFFAPDTDVCEIVLSINRNLALKKDGTHGLYAEDSSDEDKKEGFITFKEEDFGTESLREIIENKEIPKTPQRTWTDFFEEVTTTMKNIIFNHDGTDKTKPILIGYFSREKNGYYKLFGEYYNLWSYIDYYLNNELLSFIQEKNFKSIRDFWNPSSLKKLTSEDIIKMTKEMKESADRIAALEAAELKAKAAGDASKAAGDASKAKAGDTLPKSTEDGSSWRRSPDGRKLRKAYKDGTITRKQYKDGKKSIKKTLCK